MSAKILNVHLSPKNLFIYNQVSNFGFAFAMLDEELQVLHSPFQCKEYFQDIFWSEYTGNPANIYGITWNKGKLNTSRARFNVVIIGGTEFKLSERISSFKHLLNIFEKARKIPLSKVYKTTDENNIVINFSKKWTQKPMTLSCFSNLIRLSAGYNGQDIMEFFKLLNLCNDNHYSSEKYFLKFGQKDAVRVPVERLYAFYVGKDSNIEWEHFSSSLSVHSAGFVTSSGLPRQSLP